MDVLAWYQCDHLGTPQELTDHNGQMAWSAQYKAWSEVKKTALGMGTARMPDQPDQLCGWVESVCVFA
ncbi:RHS domain-containing protein [Pseudomonas lundensis]|nr:RHS domain-containing protein [Pseudomonas lundensis]